MKGDKHIDDLFSNALKGRVASGDANAAWPGARTLIDQHYRKLAFYRWIAAISATLIIAIGSAAYLLTYNAQTVNAEKQAVSTWHESSAASNVTQKRYSNTHIQNNIQTIDVSRPDETAHQSTLTQSEAFEALPDRKQKESRLHSTLSVTKGVDDMTPSKAAASNAIATDIAGPALATKITINDPSSDFQKATNRAFTENKEASKPSSSLSKENMIKMPPFEVGALGLSTNGLTQRDPLKREALMQSLRKFELLIEGAILGASSFENTGNPGASATAFGWLGGLSIQYHFHAKLYARTGALMHTRNQLNSEQVVAQSFTEEISTEPIRITYIDIPFEVGYRSKRHSFHFGLLFSPLINAKTAIWLTPLNTDTEQAAALLETEQRRDGFAGFDVAGSAGYCFQVSQRLYATGSIRYGLFDLTDNAYFATDLIDDRNHQLRLGLSYRILHR